MDADDLTERLAKNDIPNMTSHPLIREYRTWTPDPQTGLHCLPNCGRTILLPHRLFRKRGA